MNDPFLEAVVHPTPDRSILYLEGPAGAGKTTLAVRRLLNLLQEGTPTESILVWVPQRVLGRPYADALSARSVAGGEVTIATVGGLARRMIALFWPLVAERAGFAHPARPPIFLTLETTQYYMDRIATPYIDAGYFDGLSIRRNRLVSQIIDNLNKAAVVGFPHDEIAVRLKAAWQGESARHRQYEQAQACGSAFRRYCIAHNLLDFSLQLEVFFTHVLDEPLARTHLLGRYRHLIVDNVEEDTPRSHDLLKQWLGECETALVVSDRQAGYRSFLGADPEAAAEIKWLCQEWKTLNRSHVMSPAVEALGRGLVEGLGGEASRSLLTWRPRPAGQDRVDPREALRFEPVRFQPQMCEWVARQTASLIDEEGIPASEVVILAPFLGDALRFVLSEALARYNVPVRSHRPSRALRDEPAARCLLTLAAIGHPEWEHCPAPPDVAQALMVAIDGLDLVRARLLTDIVYRPHQGRPAWTAFDRIGSEAQQRISYQFGERFATLHHWMLEHAPTPSLALDDWISLAFDQVLSGPGFGFHQNLDAGRVVANLVESMQKFRQAVRGPLSEEEGAADAPGDALSLEYLRMVEQGVIAATYVQSWQAETSDAVLLAPAYTFLMSNRPVEVQFWLNVGSSGWWERLYQPLTHPYVLSRQWPESQEWSDDDEFAARQVALGRLILGLVRRCRKRVYLGVAELGEQGYEQRGALLQAIQRMLRRAQNPG